MEANIGYKARSTHLMIAPTKLRRVANVIRNKPYTEAVAILESLPQKGSVYLKKTIKSAAANALFLDNSLDEEMLYVKTLMIDEGPRMKRVWARGRGRRDILLKRMSHITVVLDEIRNVGE